MKFFDRLEDHVRAFLSKHPIPYAILGGIGVVLFWRAVWETADILMRLNPLFNFIFYPPVQFVLASLLLMVIGIMVSAFIGHRILLSGIRHEKKVEEQTEEMLKKEAVTLEREAITLETLREDIRRMRKDIERLHRP